jgi:hypothetical protein
MFSTARSAFSLIELIVAVSLMTVIVLGLMAMFTQTQRAFRLGMSQTDVLEAGRMATDMIARELREMTPSDLVGTNQNSANFYAGPINSDNFAPQISPASYVPLQLNMLGNPPQQPERTNTLCNLFFLTRENQTWTGIGYFVRTNGGFQSPWGPVGTLYRVEATNTEYQLQHQSVVSPIFAYFNQTNNVSKIMDGVVDFTIRAYDTNGFLITPVAYGFSPVSPTVRTNYCLAPQNANVAEPSYLFYSNAVPAFVEFDLGILETQTYEQYKSLPTEAARMNFLVNQTGHVHLFRQRIPIRNVDVTAYQ